MLRGSSRNPREEGRRGGKNESALDAPRLKGRGQRPLDLGIEQRERVRQGGGGDAKQKKREEGEEYVNSITVLLKPRQVCYAWSIIQSK